jgi:hypothetical protein
MNETIVNPGYGYRFLKTGETIAKTDEVYMSALGSFERTGDAGRIVRAHDLTYRRKIEAGVGYRIVDENEPIRLGDENMETWRVERWGPVSISIGLTPKQDGRSDLVWRRKVEAPKPAVDVGKGYRLLGKSDTIKAGDEYLNFFSEWQRASISVGCSIAGSKTTRRRKIAPTREEQLQAELNSAKETIVAKNKETAALTAQLDAANKTIAELSKQIEMMRKNASGNAVLVDGYWSRPVVLPEGVRSVSWMISSAWMTQSAFSHSGGLGKVTFERTDDIDGFGRTIFRRPNSAF